MNDAPAAETAQTSVHFTRTKLTSIACSLCFAVIPMIVLTVVFLTLVFAYRLDVNDIPYPDLTPHAFYHHLDDAYYVKLSSTFILQVSSWASTVAPLCGGIFVTLASYPICRAYLLRVKLGHEKALPTPFQLSLLIRFLEGGSYGALWSWILYCVTWRKRQRQATPVKQIAGVTLLVAFLSFLIFLADTWLHNSTSMVDEPVFEKLEPPPYSGVGLTSRFSAPNCSNAAASHCVLTQTDTNFSLVNPDISQEVINNVSSLAAVSDYADDRGSFSFLHTPFTTESPIYNFIARGYAIQTQCRSASQQCNVRADSGGQTGFNCSSSFNSVSQLKAGWSDAFYGAYFTNSTMTSLSSPSTDTNAENTSVTNPFYFGYFGRFDDIVASGDLHKDPEIIGLQNGGTSFVLLCNASMFDVTYSFVNGSVVIFHTTPSNQTIANLFQAPMAYTTVSRIGLQAAAQAAVSTSRSAKELADKFADDFSTTTLAIGAQVVEEWPGNMSVMQFNRMFTRITRRSLWTFVAINTTFVLTGFVLAAWAARVVLDPAVNDLQGRLSIVGLVADRFEGPRSQRIAGSIERLFEESEANDSSRVVIVGSANGGQGFGLLRRGTTDMLAERQSLNDSQHSLRKSESHLEVVSE
ncbi:hypothetical protein K461DRAFT_273808 [Myriangium duriaei CBS 260.36]|uniref:Uncharacterized protein n=1 Tax=Myriangium duriaei CBS 260.36 TaxID=1168546 RepID=A0A9P4J9M4_9PEZI|nr:hypothetical protein K461DRAFT_273808 [Myriangium duriaei CBS 260.36]